MRSRHDRDRHSFTHLLVFISVVILSSVALDDMVSGANRKGSSSEEPSHIGSILIGTADDSLEFICDQIYQYRSLGTLYDSIAARCTYGELCIPGYYGQDSLFIGWTTEYESPGIEAAAGYLNSVLVSKPFLLTDSASLSMVRVIATVSDYETSTYSLPDTTAWMLELWRRSDNTKLATIDSVGICRADNYPIGTFPKFFGFMDTMSVEMVSVFLGSYAAAGNPDSVYLRLKMKNWHTANDSSCAVFDEFNCNTKWSAFMGLAKSGAGRVSGHSPSHMITAFPNPTRSPKGMLRFALPSDEYITLSIYSIAGKWISTFFTGARSAGVNSIPFDLSAIGPGTYIIQIAARDGNIIASQKVIYIK